MYVSMIYFIDSISYPNVEVSPFSLDETTFPRVQTVIDSSIATSSSDFAVRARSSSETLFLSGKDLLTYLKSVETGENKLHEIDFEALKAEAGTPAPAAPKAAAKEKEDAKIEGAVQISIGVKKEVDFPTWYTNVGRDIRSMIR
jgi:prolyl-tRNA synthetase